MISSPSIVLLIMALGLLTAGCTHPPPARANSASSPPPDQRSVLDDAAAVESANAFLRRHGLEWDEPTQILRTVSHWYRIEYARDRSGREHVVLVNPADGRPEFPLPR